MAILAGQEAEGSGVAIAVTAEVGRATRYEVLKSGTITALHVKFSSKLAATVTSVRIAVIADAAGPAPKTESALAEGVKTSPGEVFEVEVAGLSLAVTAGEFIWIATEIIGAAGKIKPGTTGSSAESPSKKAELKLMKWNAATALAPMSMWATGTESGETKTVTALVHGAGAATVNALKVATPAALVHGAGLASTTALKVGLATASVTGAGAATVKASKTAVASALVHGAGNATVTITPAGEVKIVTALVHGAGRASVVALHVGIATAKVTGAGSATVVTRKIAVTTAAVTGAGTVTVKTSRTGIVTAKVTGAGRASTTVSRIAIVTARVTGAGRATVTIASGIAPTPCLMHLSALPAISMTLTTRAVITMTLTTRPAVGMSLEAK